MITVSSNLLFKTRQIRDQFVSGPVDPRLIGQLLTMGWYCAQEGLPPPFITSLIRWDRTSSPHYPNPVCRAADIRCKDDYWEGEENERKVLEFVRRHFPSTDMLLLEGGTNLWIGRTRIHGEGPHRHMHLTVEPRQQYLSRLRILPPP